MLGWVRPDNLGVRLHHAEDAGVLTPQDLRPVATRNRWSVPAVAGRGPPTLAGGPREWDQRGWRLPGLAGLDLPQGRGHRHPALAPVRVGQRLRLSRRHRRDRRVRHRLPEGQQRPVPAVGVAPVVHPLGIVALLVHPGDERRSLTQLPAASCFSVGRAAMCYPPCAIQSGRSWSSRSPRGRPHCRRRPGPRSS